MITLKLKEMNKILPNRKRLLLRILILQIILSGLLVCCKKTDMSSQEDAGLVKELVTDKTPANRGTVTTEPYNATVFDSCRKENIILSGETTYKFEQSFDKGYYLYYEIDLDKINGVGERTGIDYHGGGKIVGTVKQNVDGTSLKSKVTYRVKYTGSNGNQVSFIQNAKFIIVNNVVKVDFNNIFDSCK